MRIVPTPATRSGSRGGVARIPCARAGEWLGTDVPLHAHHQRPVGMGLHICAVVQRGSSSASEHVEIVDDGAEPVPVTALELMHCSGQHHKHVYSFPEGGGRRWPDRLRLQREGHEPAHAHRRPDPVRRPAGSRLEGRVACRIPVLPGWQDHRHDARGTPATPPRRPLIAGGVRRRRRPRSIPTHGRAEGSTAGSVRAGHGYSFRRWPPTQIQPLGATSQ
jgi:hypothetical protein